MSSASVGALRKGCEAMAHLSDSKARRDMVKRLRRVEGQLRGVARMIEEGEDCLSVAQQMTASRKALDSAFSRMMVCFLEQELGEAISANPKLEHTLGEMGVLLKRLG